LRERSVEPALVFLSGVGVTLTGALIAHVLTRQRERRKLVDERRFEIYMKLMDLNSQYFWIASAEVRGQPASPETRRNCRDLAWQIADILRAADEVEFLEEILDITFGPGYPTAAKRHDAMGALLDRMGERVNPRYARKIREISKANVLSLGSGARSNAPGATWPLE
ncbi:MAG: hypothetical protein ACREA0_30425, partial [bacterium]